MSLIGVPKSETGFIGLIIICLRNSGLLTIKFFVLNRKNRKIGIKNLKCWTETKELQALIQYFRKNGKSIKTISTVAVSNGSLGNKLVESYI